jgi:hypothetical protein
MYFTTPDNPSSTRQAYEFEESEPTTMQDVLSTSEYPDPHIVLETASTPSLFIVSVEKDLSPFENKR